MNPSFQINGSQHILKRLSRTTPFLLFQIRPRFFMPYQLTFWWSDIQPSLFSIIIQKKLEKWKKKKNYSQTPRCIFQFFISSSFNWLLNVNGRWNLKWFLNHWERIIKIEKKLLLREGNFKLVQPYSILFFIPWNFMSLIWWRQWWWKW